MNPDKINGRDSLWIETGKVGSASFVRGCGVRIKAPKRSRHPSKLSRAPLIFSKLSLSSLHLKIFFFKNPILCHLPLSQMSLSPSLLSSPAQLSLLLFSPPQLSLAKQAAEQPHQITDFNVVPAQPSVSDLPFHFKVIFSANPSKLDFDKKENW